MIMSMDACNGGGGNASAEKKESDTGYEKGTFGYDLQFLQKHDSVIVLGNEPEQARVVVSAKYQAKVFTSTAAGSKGKSFGWINYKAFDAPVDAHMNAYGGENRFWLGPEGNRFSLFFEKGRDMVFDNWKTPAAFDTEAWAVTHASDSSVTMQKDMVLKNYAGTELEVEATRTISLLNKTGIEAQTGVPLPAEIRSVGYLASNQIVNRGQSAWNDATGMPCIWMLDMFTPSPATTIVVPYNTAVSDTASKVATTDYFGAIPADRVHHRNGILYFKADGKSRGKLGLTPVRARNAAGSYDATGKVLTIILFDVDRGGRYLNQEWNTRKPPFQGDAVNAYNDGPLADGSQMGPFYELESVSPAAALQPGAHLTHNHTVLHFTGPESALNQITTKVLGVGIEEIRKAF